MKRHILKAINGQSGFIFMIRSLALLALACMCSFAQYPVQITPYQVIDARTGQAVPCVGCQIFTYAAGTTTPLATYTDSTLGTPNTDPVLTNPAGYAVNGSTITGIWVGAAACYKFVLEDASNVVIWTQDRICSPTTTSATQLISGVVSPAVGGTGHANSATITLGTAPVNLASLGTGMVCNTTATGLLYNCQASDVTAPFSGCSAPVSFSGTTQTNATVLVSNTAGLVVGMFVSGSGIPANSTILNIVMNTSISISMSATASATVPLTATSSQLLGYNGTCITPVTGRSPDGYLVGANFNSTLDQPITMNIPAGFSRYAVRHITVSNASTSLSAAVGGFYTLTGKGGTQVVANTQAYSGLTNPALFFDATLAAVSLSPGNAYTQSTLYLSLTTPQGVAATADISIYVDFLP